MNTKLLITLLCLVMLGQVQGQYQIKGHIFSSQGEALVGATVSLDSLSVGTISNESGYFELELPSKDIVLWIQYVGYESLKQKWHLEQAVTHINFYLDPSKNILNQVIVQEYSQDMSNVSPSLRLKTPIQKLSQNIQVVNQGILRDQGLFTMMESITRNVSGAQMIEHWGHFARINMRGFRIPAFRNGVNLMMSWGPLAEDMSMVEQIEFVKGPAGFMMSVGEPGGMYNVVTKQAKPTKFSQFDVAIGSFHHYRLAVDHNATLAKGKLLYRINAMGQYGESHRDHEHNHRLSLVPTFTYHLTAKTKISTEFTLQRSVLPIGSAYVFAPESKGFGSLDKTFSFIDSKFPHSKITEISTFNRIQHQLNSNWSIEGLYAYVNYDQLGNSTWPQKVFGEENVIRGVNLWDALGETNIGQVYTHGKVFTQSVKHQILGGIDYNKRAYWADWSQNFKLDSENQPFNILKPDYSLAMYSSFDRSKSLKNREATNYREVESIAAYVQDELHFFDDKLRVTLAGRLSHAKVISSEKERTTTRFVPRFGISYDLLAYLSIYGLYDQAFLPQTGLNYYGENFDPLSSHNIEGGVKWQINDGRLQMTAGAFQITKNNILVSDPEHLNFSIQIGQVQSKGMEVDVKGYISPQLSAVFNYALTHVEITKDSDPAKVGSRVAGHAKHLNNAWMHYQFSGHPILSQFGLSLGYQWQVDRSSWNWNSESKALLPNYFRLDGGISWKKENYTLRLNVNNILNQYLYSGSTDSNFLYWQSEPGINFKLSGSIRL